MAATEMPELRTEVACTFCLKPASDVETVVAGAGVYICNECVALCAELIATKPAAGGMPSLPWEERISDDELLALLPRVAATGAQVDRRLTLAVRQARLRGITWTRIGGALGVTRQSAWERFSGED